MNSKITYDIFSTVDSIVRLLDEFENPSCSSPYQRIEYLKLAIQNHFPYSILRCSRPIFIRFNIDGIPSLIMPFSKSLFSENYCFFGDRAGAGYLDVIYRGDLSPLLARACFELLIKEFQNSFFYFNRIKKNTQTYSILSEMVASSGSEKCVAVAIRGDYNFYYQSLSIGVRQNFRTAKNRILKHSKSLSILQLNGKEVSGSILNAMVSLYVKRLGGRYNGRFRFINALFLRFFDIGFIAMRKLDFSIVYLIYVDNKLAGFMYCLVEGDELIVPRLAIDDSFSFYSPGILLVMSAIKGLYLSEEIKNFDLMHGQESYKFKVGGELHECYSFQFSKNNLLKLAA